MAASERDVSVDGVSSLPGDSFNFPGDAFNRERSSSEASRSTPQKTCLKFCLVGDSLELMIAPGDTLVAYESSDASNAAMLVVVRPPRSISRNSTEGLHFQPAWPDDAAVKELWAVRTLQCSRQSVGLQEAEILLYVARSTGKLTLIAELAIDGKLVLLDRAELQVWQSPRKLRECIRLELMDEVLSDMRDVSKSCMVEWLAEAEQQRPALKSMRNIAKEKDELTLETVMEDWFKAPFCTSIVIIFWQRYLCKLSNVVVSKRGKEQRVEPSEMIMRWMPLRADRVAPDALLSSLRSFGWVSLVQIPRIFQPMVTHNVPPENTLQPQSGVRLVENAANKARGLKLGASSDPTSRDLELTVVDSHAVTLTC